MEPLKINQKKSKNRIPVFNQPKITKLKIKCTYLSRARFTEKNHYLFVYQNASLTRNVKLSFIVLDPDRSSKWKKLLIDKQTAIIPFSTLD